METMEFAIQAADVRQAAARIAPLIRHTPVLSDEVDGRRVFFKCENLQRGGAFKLRGASNLILSLAPEQLRRGIVTYSSGNHAQAVAIAAAHVGAQATIVMPEDAPRIKIESTRKYGARIVTYNRFTQDREEIAAGILKETGGTLAPPFDHPMIMAGQGTAALELLSDAGPLDALITPVGGGGLLAGCATIAKAIDPAIRVFGAEPANANDTFLSLAAGRRVRVEPDTIADGLRSPTPGQLTFPVIQHLVEAILLVSEEEIRAAARRLLLEWKLVVEPSGAVSAAAVFFGRLPEEIRSVGMVLSGGNVDFEEIVKY
ncbi:MAG: threonine/serine dehydratase [Bryobacteraceae bacterium]|jgi:threonine dehydratase